ncbi:MAG: acyl-CoA thioesterase [Cyanobacteria bacterium J06627_32]
MTQAKSAVYQHELAVPTGAIDENGHLNNVEYVRLMQEVAIAHAKNTPCAEETAKAGATWIARSHRIEYLRPAFESEHLVILTWCASIRRVRAQRQYRFFRKRDRTLIASGETDWIFADIKTGRPRSIPSEVSAAFELLPEHEAPRELLDKHD